MEDNKISQNILPSNYVTLVQLQERWKKQQQDRSNDRHQQQQKQNHKEQDNNHPSNCATLAQSQQQWKQNKHQKQQQEEYDEDKKQKQKQQPEEEQQIDGKDKQITRGSYGRNRRLKNRNFTGSSSGASPSVKENQNENENDAVLVASAVEGNDAACVPAFIAAVEGNEKEIKKKKKRNKRKNIKRNKEKELIKDGETAITQGEEAEKASVREEHAPPIKSQKDNIIPPMRYGRKRNTGMVNCIYRAKNAVETVREEGVEIIDMKIGELSVDEGNHERSEKQSGVVATDDNGSNYSNSNSSVYRGYIRSVNNRRNSQHGGYNGRNSQYGGYNGRNSQYGGHKGRNLGYRDYEYDCGIRGRNWRFAQRNGSIGMVWVKKGEAADGEGTGNQSSSSSVKDSDS